ncbi:MAG: transposase [Clostridia bacterium]|nr:transposase [Clostridia bacterium]
MNDLKQPLPQRKKIRLENFDYSANGSYFITICTKNRQPILSNVISVGDDAHIVPQLSEIGKIADKYIKNIPQVTKYVIMPDHIHLILCLDNRDDEGIVPYKSVSNIVRSFKTMVTKEVGTPLFQRSFYDHVVRNFGDYIETFEYIENNPSNWFIKNNPQK